MASVFLQMFQAFMNSYPIEHLRTAVSALLSTVQVKHISKKIKPYSLSSQFSIQFSLILFRKKGT